MFKLQRLIQRIDFVSAKHISLLNKRTKFTLTKMDASETCPIQRPTPILLLNTIATKEQDIFDWSNKLQSQFSKEGYFSVSINMTLPDKEPLKTCYQELKQATSELSFFPPLMISSGEIAWRISQTYVSNRPVSGLIMVEDHHHQPPINQEILDKFYPTSEFEPHFPLLMISSSSSSVPHFLNGWIDHINLESTSNNSHHLFKTILQWMDDIGM